MLRSLPLILPGRAAFQAGYISHSGHSVNSVQITMIRILLSLFLLLPSLVSAASFYYTTSGADAPVVELRLNPESGGLVAHREIGKMDHPRKLSLDRDGSKLVVTSEDTKEVRIFEVGEAEPAPPVVLMLDEPTSDVRAGQGMAVISAEKGWFYRVDLDRGEITNRWSSRKELNPSGHKGESLYFSPDGKLVLSTFQKDSSSGKHKGSRVVALNVEDFSLAFDLQLPRSREELHYTDNLKERGPNPEILFFAPEHNALALSLDLYGAVAFADLDAALEGRWSGYTDISSATDDSWGGTFPDRGCVARLGPQTFLLISNASKDGGLALFDFGLREKLKVFPVEAGAEHPVYLPAVSKAATVVSGKIKSRGPSELTNNRPGTPGTDLLVVDLSPLADGGEATMDRVPMGVPLIRIQAISPETSPLVLLGTADDRFLIYNIETRTLIGEIPALGPINRLIAAQ